MRKDPIRRSCADCGVTRCINGPKEGESYPDFCLTEHTDKGFVQEVVKLYGEEENHKVMEAAAGVECDFYCQKTRVEEVIEFAKRIGAKKIGIATCVALIRESRTLAKMLRANGFEVFGVGCKTGEIFKTALGIDAAHQGPGPVACNPVLQAQLLNEAGTELNIVMGLCVGHDSLFYKHAQAVTTTLVVKDRVLVHNPVMALYTADGYYANLMEPLEDE